MVPVVQLAPTPFMITSPESSPSPVTVNDSVFQSDIIVTITVPWVAVVGMNVIGSVIVPLFAATVSDDGAPSV